MKERKMSASEYYIITNSSSRTRKNEDLPEEKIIARTPVVITNAAMPMFMTNWPITICDGTSLWAPDPGWSTLPPLLSMSSAGADQPGWWDASAADGGAGGCGVDSPCESDNQLGSDMPFYASMYRTAPMLSGELERKKEKKNLPALDVNQVNMWTWWSGRWRNATPVSHRVCSQWVPLLLRRTCLKRPNDL